MGVTRPKADGGRLTAGYSPGWKAGEKWWRQRRAEDLRSLLFATGPALALTVIGIHSLVPTAVSELKVALGDGGARGTATVVSCRSYGSGRSRGQHCSARFTAVVPELPPVVLPTVEEVREGETFPAALSPSGDYVIPTGGRGVWKITGRLAVLLFYPAAAMILAGIVVGRFSLLWTGVALFASALAVLILYRLFGG